MKFSFYMVASIACDSVDFMWKWRLILMCFCFSSTHEQISDQICEFFDNGTIILKKLGEFSDAPLHIKQSFYNKCDCLHTLSFELYPNFKFSIELIDEVLSERDLIIISIRFDDELKKLLRRRKVSSNEYVDRFLENFLHTQSSVMLDFSSLRLSDIPESIYKFSDLKTLIFYNMDLKIFKLDCERLKELISLKICESKKITELDVSIFNLPSLLSLKISGCSIKEIPDDINKLKNLSSLEIAKSPIKSLPRNLSNLKSLYSLIISDCVFKEIVISMTEHPKLVNVYLNSNYSLKCLKLLTLEIHKGFDNFEISGCPLKEVEILLNLKIPKFCTLSRNDQKLENFDYLIQFNPIKMFSFPKNKRKSDSKIYEFNISAASSGPNKIISIREFRFKKTRTRVVNKYKLIVKWIKICEKFHFENTVVLRVKYYHSIEFLINLFDIHSIDFSDWSTSFPFEYKDKLASILYNLFDKLRESSESRVIDILEMFKRPHVEQLIYFNYLLKVSKPCSPGEKFLIAFIKESIEILRDYTFTVFLNLEKYKYGQSLRSTKRSHSDKKPIFIKNKNNGAFRELLNAVISAKKNFDSNIIVEYFSEIITNVIARIGDLILFGDDEMIKLFLENFEIGPEFFEFETQANTDIVKRLNVRGMKVLISLIVNGRILIHDE